MAKNKRNKKNKGTVSRGKAYRTYKRAIVKAYNTKKKTLEDNYYESACTLADRRFFEAEISKLVVERDKALVRVEKAYKK
jgi:hypothetical protein